MPIIKEHRRKSIGSAAVVVHIENPDNWVSLSVNGSPLTYQEGGVFTQNITSLIESGTPNVIVLALINTYVPSFNPASVSARLEVGERRSTCLSHQAVRALFKDCTRSPQ